jgi:hypothetical protein
MNKVEEFIDNNKPTRFYRVLRKFSLGFGRYKLEVRILKDER